MLGIVFAAAVASVAATELPKDEPTPLQPFMILSEGQVTCGEFIAQPNNQSTRMEWVLGYISDADSRAPNPYRLVGRSFEKPDTVIGWLQSYCASHGLDTLSTAAEALRKDFFAHERGH